MRTAAKTRSAWLLAMLAVLGSPGAARAEDEPLVKEVASSEQELRDDGKHTEVRFALAPLDGADVASLRASLARVSAGKLADPDLMPGFSAEVKSLPGLGPTLVVRVDFEIAAAPATYEVEIALTGKRWDATLTQRLVVRLAHPAARLRPPGPLVVSRSWLLRPLSQYPGTLAIEEASHHSRLSGLVVEQVAPPLHDGEPVEGRLSFGEPVTIAPGAIASLPVSIEGSFPVGTTRGRLAVRAPQLEEPVLVDYELRVRVPTPVIPAVFLVGSLLGQLVRNVLKNREKRLAEALAARDLRERLERLAARSKPEDEAALRGAAKDLAPDAEGDELEQAMTRGRALLVSSLAARGAAQRALLTEVGSALAVLGRGWTLPAAVDPATVVKALETAQRCAVDDDLVAAEVARGDATVQVRALARAARAWAASMARRVDKVAEGEAAGAADSVHAALAPIVDGDTDLDLEPLLRAVHTANVALLSLAQRGASALDGAAEEAAVAASSSEQAEAIRAAAQLDEARVLTDAGEALDRVADARRSLHEAVKKVVTTMMPAGATARAAVDGLVEARCYPQALAAARAAVPMHEGPLALSVSDDAPPSFAPRPASAPARGGLRSLFARGPEPAMTGSMSVLVLASGGAQAPADRATLARQLSQTRTAQMLIAAAIMALLAWALYAREFFGTTQELISLFALGFTTDLSTDALLAALDKAKKA